MLFCSAPSIPVPCQHAHSAFSQAANCTVPPVSRRDLLDQLPTITVTMPRKKMPAIIINWSLAKCSCPSWSANTDESALRIALASLDECNSSLHWWLGFWTVLVVVGVALELVFVVWEYVDELHDFRRGIVHPPDRPNRLLFALGFFATGLVALGVGGELYAESKIATLETCVRKGNDALFLLLSKEAGDAAKSAKTAHEEADTVGQEAAALKIQLGAVAKRAEEIDAGLAQTQWLLSARSIQNRDELADAIKQQFKGRDVVTRSYIGDQEGWGLCTQFWYVAKSAEMKPVNQCGMAQLEVPLTSPIAISGPDVDETLKLGQLINRIGRIGGWSAIKAPVLTIFVGAKSPFMIGQARGVKAPTKKQTKKQSAKP